MKLRLGTHLYEVHCCPHCSIGDSPAELNAARLITVTSKCCLKRCSRTLIVRVGRLKQGDLL